MSIGKVVLVMLLVEAFVGAMVSLAHTGNERFDYFVFTMVVMLFSPFPVLMYHQLKHGQRGNSAPSDPMDTINSIRATKQAELVDTLLRQSRNSRG